jgi:predicted transcriptional regulator
MQEQKYIYFCYYIEIVRLSKNEVKLLIEVIRSKNDLQPNDLAVALEIRETSVYKIITRLEQKGLVDKKLNYITPSLSLQAESFKKLYHTHPTSPFDRLLVGERIDLLFKLNEKPKSVEELSKETGISKFSVYYFLKDLAKLGVVRKTKEKKPSKYSFNYVLWNDLKAFLVNLHEIESLVKIPAGGLLIKDYGDYILIKSIRKLDATPTSFSVYGDYGIQLFLRTGNNYYILPKKDLSIKDVFIHSLDSADEMSQKLYCILFYLKNKSKLKGVRHPMMKHIHDVLEGKNIKGYPSLEDVMDRMVVYAL